MLFDRFGSACLILILLLSVILGRVHTVTLETEVNGNFFFDPQEYAFDVSELGVGDKFNVTIMASNLTQLWGYQIKLSYNATILRCTNVFVTPDNPLEGYNYVFDFDLEVLGTINLVYWFQNASEGVNVIEAGLNLIEFEITLTPLSGQVDSTFEFSWIGLVMGTYWLRTLDPTRIAPSCTNGYYLLSMELPDLPDVLVDNIQSDTFAFVGDIVPIVVRAWDAGTTPESFNVTVYADTNITTTGDEVIVGTQTVSLFSREFVTLTFSWNTSGLAGGNYTLSAVATQVPGEADTTNNQLVDGTISIFAPVPCQDIEITAPTNITLNPAIFSYNSTFRGLQLSMGNMTVKSTGDEGILGIYGSTNGTISLWISQPGLDWREYYLPENETILVPLWLGFDPATHWEEYNGTYTMQLTVCGTHRLKIAVEIIHFNVCENGAHSEPNGTISFTWNLTDGSLVYLVAETSLPPGWTYEVDPPIGVFFETPQIVRVNITAAGNAQAGDIGTVTLQAFKNSTGVMIWHFTYFSIVGDEPTIIEAVQEPIHSSDEDLLFNVTVKDLDSGIENVRLFYSVDGGGWDNMTMIWQRGDTFNASTYATSIPLVPDGSEVRYYIVATDWLGNQTQSSLYTQNIIYDLATSNVSYDRDVVTQGSSFLANITVCNEGTMRTQSLKVAVYANTTLLQLHRMPTIPANQSVILALNCNITNLARGKYKLKVFVVPLKNEQDIADNALTFGFLTVSIQGDVNGDGIVELTDFFLASQAFGSTPSDPNWNPNADINDDEIVELIDFWIMSEHFGETW